MTNITHPGMKRRKTAPQPPLENQNVTTVLNAEDEQETFQREMADVSSVVEAQSYADDNVLYDPVMEEEEERKKAFEKILLFRRPHTKTITIQDSEFVVKILNANDNDAIFEKVMGLSENEQVSRTPIMILAGALMHVNGIPVEDLYEGDEADTLYRKYHEVSRWPAPLTKSLIKAYNAFTLEMDKEFSAPFLDESPKTDTTD